MSPITANLRLGQHHGGSISLVTLGLEIKILFWRGTGHTRQTDDQLTSISLGLRNPRRTERRAIEGRPVIASPLRRRDPGRNFVQLSLSFSWRVSKCWDGMSWWWSGRLSWRLDMTNPTATRGNPGGLWGGGGIWPISVAGWARILALGVSDRDDCIKKAECISMAAPCHCWNKKTKISCTINQYSSLFTSNSELPA